MTGRINATVYALLIGLSVAVLLMFANGLTDRVSSAEEAAARSAASSQANADSLAAADAAVVELTQQVRSLGEQPVASPADVPDAVEPSPDFTISDAQVRAAVSAYCASGACRGPQGDQASASQVDAAVRAYCSNGRCQGPRGRNGLAGDAGDAGAVGAAGPGPTDAQVAAAVSSYCADGACRGAAGSDGKDGANGSDGKDGRGIASIVCDSATPFNLTVTYSDGTEQTYTCGPGA